MLLICSNTAVILSGHFRLFLLSSTTFSARQIAMEWAMEVRRQGTVLHGNNFEGPSPQAVVPVKQRGI